MLVVVVDERIEEVVDYIGGRIEKTMTSRRDS